MKILFELLEYITGGILVILFLYIAGRVITLGVIKSIRDTNQRRK